MFDPRLSSRFWLSTALACLATMGVPSGARADVTFGPWTIYPTGSQPADFGVGDLNHDGRTDVLVSTYAGDDADGGSPAPDSLLLYLQKSDGTLAAPQVVATFAPETLPAMQIEVGDLNDDGLVDVLYSGAGGLFALYQRDNGRLGPPTAIKQQALPPSARPAISLADMNGDGKADIVEGDINAGTYVMYRKGTSSFRSVQVPTGDCCIGAIGDYNHDGLKDLAERGTNPLDGHGEVTILRQTLSGTFSPVQTLNFGFGTPTLLAGADVTSDGRDDLLATEQGYPGDLAVFTQRSDGTLGDVASYSLSDSNPQSLAFADFDATGSLDVAVAQPGSSSIGLLLQGSSGLTSAPDVPLARLGFSGSASVIAADLDSDGRPDLAVLMGQTGLVVAPNNTR